MSRQCEMTMEGFDFRAYFYSCGKPAKYITPKDKFLKRKLYVCGIHRNTVDAFYKRKNLSKKCKKL